LLFETDSPAHIYQLSKEGKTGAITVFNVPLGHLSSKTTEELQKHLL